MGSRRRPRWDLDPRRPGGCPRTASWCARGCGWAEPPTGAKRRRISWGPARDRGRWVVRLRRWGVDANPGVGLNPRRPWRGAADGEPVCQGVWVGGAPHWSEATEDQPGPAGNDGRQVVRVRGWVVDADPGRRP